MCLTHICRDEQRRIQLEFPGEPREPQRRSSEPHGWLERGTPGRRKLQTTETFTEYCKKEYWRFQHHWTHNQVTAVLKASGQLCLSGRCFGFFLEKQNVFSIVASTQSSSTSKVEQLKMTTVTSSSSLMQLHALTPPSKNVSWRKNQQDFCPREIVCNLSLTWCSALFNIQIYNNIPSARWYGILKTMIAMKNIESKHIQRVTKVMMKIWVPDPRKTDSSIPFRGGRKTSPWTSFQPNSSWASSLRSKERGSRCVSHH